MAETGKCRIEGDSGFNPSVDGEEWKSLPIDIEFPAQEDKVFAPSKTIGTIPPAAR